mmetsp:Transcript_15901/g.36815  ORF Transcript_15901/g.36815 Transcript_15901/m.36815 type:complete len:232 (+) Transcript_15901:1385-2080(+)
MFAAASSVFSTGSDVSISAAMMGSSMKSAVFSSSLSTTSLFFPSSITFTVSGIVIVNACANATRTVDWANPILSLPCRPRMMNLVSVESWTATKRRLILSTLNFCDELPEMLAISRYTARTRPIVNAFGLTPKPKVLCFDLHDRATSPRSPIFTHSSLTADGLDPYASDIAFTNRPSPIPSSTHSYAGATALLARYTAERRSSGRFPNLMIRRKNLAITAWISNLPEISSI